MIGTKYGTPKSTRVILAEEAVKLFAIYGYEGTSLEDIAATIGVTKQAIYRHFKNKEDIYYFIVEMMTDITDWNAKQFFLGGMPRELVIRFTEDDICAIQVVACRLFRYWARDKIGSAFRKMVVSSQFKSDEGRALFVHFMMDHPVKFISKIIKEVGVIATDADKLAFDFYVKVYYLYGIYDCKKDMGGAERMLNDYVRELVKKIKEILKGYDN